MKKQTNKTKLHFRRYKGVYALTILEIVIVWFFVVSWLDCMPLSARKLENVTVYVEHSTRTTWGRLFVVRSGGESYVFPKLGSYTEGYTNSKLDQIIQRGDKLHLTYVEDRWFFRMAERNLVVAARTDEIEFRTLDEFAESKDGMQTIIVVIFVIAELLYSYGLFAYFRFNREYFTRLKKDRKKRREKKIQQK